MGQPLLFKLKTQKPAELEECMINLRDRIFERSRGQIGAIYSKLDDNTFHLAFHYPLRNRIYDKFIKKTLESTVKELDPEILIEKV